MNGKGSKPRPVDKNKYNENYDLIFRKHVKPIKNKRKTRQGVRGK